MAKRNRSYAASIGATPQGISPIPQRPTARRTGAAAGAYLQQQTMGRFGMAAGAYADINMAERDVRKALSWNGEWKSVRR